LTVLFYLDFGCDHTFGDNKSSIKHMKNLNEMTTQQIILIITATAAGLTAGLFYAFSCSVNLGLGKLADDAYLSAMQSINKEILNPVFFAGFMGTLFLLPLSTWYEYKNGLSVNFYLLAGATLFYAIGTFGVTMGGNVPLNEVLERFDIHAASAAEQALQRKAFEQPWNAFHAVRTTASLISFVLVVIACVKGK
jgi:uncharacterized membrane protein